jgi:hypothetical protein
MHDTGDTLNLWHRNFWRVFGVETDDSKFLDYVNLLSPYFLQLQESHLIIRNTRYVPKYSEKFK